MKKISLFLISLLSFKLSNSQTVTITNSKTPPSELTTQFLKTFGDSTKFMSDEFNVLVYLINKKDTVELGGYTALEYSIKPIFELAAKFDEVGKTKSIFNGQFTILSINTKSISFCDFIYEDLVKSKRYHFYMTKQKLKELLIQIDALLVDN